MRPAALCLILAVSLAACGDETPLKAPPTVAASPDLDLPVRDVVYLAANARDVDGQVASFKWSLVSAPDPTQTGMLAKGARGEVLELRTGGIAGLYVLSVVAVDDDELESEPDYVNLTLRAPVAWDLEIGCVEGCEELPDELRAQELTTLLLEARRGGQPAGVTWSAELVRDPLDPYYDDPAVSARPSTAQVEVPRVARAARLVVTARNEDGQTAQLELAVPNGVDEPPTIALEWSQPSGAPLPPGANGQAVVLPGDALWVTATVSDPNGDAVACTFALPDGLQYEQRGSDDPCRITLFPLSAGTLQVEAAATTLEPVARAEAEPLRIAVSPFVLEQGGPSLTAASIDAQGRVMAVGEAAAFHVYRDGHRDSYVTGLTEGSAAAISAGVAPEMGFVGWSSTGSWSRFNFESGEQETNLAWGATTNPPVRTWAMAAGEYGMVFAGTDQGIAYWDGSGGLQQWRPENGLEVRAIAVGPDGFWYDGAMGYVWFAYRSVVYCHIGESPLGWGEPDEIGMVPGDVGALAAGPAGLWDLWVGVGQGTSGTALHLYRDAVNPETGVPQMLASEAFFENEGPVESIAVERQGPYAGDAWAVLRHPDAPLANRLVRVSRAMLNGGSEPAAVALPLNVQFGNASPRSVAVANGAVRKVVLASDQGLVSAP